MDQTYLIVGLGNPGSKYEKTYHNVGWMAVDALAAAYDININRSKFNGLYGQGWAGDNKLIFLKPTTYMNNSGEAVAAYARFFKLQPSQIAVIYDDIDLPSGTMRIREKGGPGTHNGMKSIVNLLGSRDFPRFRLGIGPLPGKMDLISYVLAKMTEADLAATERLFKDLKLALDYWIGRDIQFAMNRLNRRPGPVRPVGGKSGAGVQPDAKSGVDIKPSVASKGDGEN